MSIIQKLAMIATTFRRTRSRIYYRFSCFQGHCPTSDEITNSGIKSLANRLKADSYRKTFTNILEWQERNIMFWTERHPIGTLFYGFFGSFIVIGVLLFFRILDQNVPNFWVFSILVAIVVMIFVTMGYVLYSNRKFRGKKILRGLWYIVKPSISMNFLLENKLGVCRDYAKLTACLLLNIYPNSEIYFAGAPNHMATGINIENRLYMLDQRLPILTKDRWNDYRKPRRSHKIERFEPSKKTLQKTIHPQIKDKSELNIERTSALANRMAGLLKIKEQQDNESISLQKPIRILWKNGAILYEENEMVDYSLSKWVEMKISSELIKINQIARITISHEKDDLTFLIYLKNERFISS